MTDTREALEEAAVAIWGEQARDVVIHDQVMFERMCRFDTFLDAEAWIDAAMMLVPEGMAWSLYSDGPTYDASCAMGPHPVGGEMMREDFIGEGSTPALALAAACLKAKDQADG